MRNWGSVNSAKFRKRKPAARFVLVILIFFSLGAFLLLMVFPKKPAATPVPKPEILTETRTTVVLSPTPMPSPSASPSPTPKVDPKPSPNKSSYVVAAFGDSMVDTMGENLDYLDKALMARYPTTKFKFYNYGIGSQNVIDAIKRFNDPLIYKDRDYLPITQIEADVIIVSSFAYNPLEPYDRTLYLESLRGLINKSKSTGAKVYLLAEIAPIKTGFGKGVGGVNWDEEKVATHVAHIFSNLDGAVGLAARTKTPLINAYKKSQTDGKYGDQRYVGTHDGIHPSIEGEVFMADVIADSIDLP